MEALQLAAPLTTAVYGWCTVHCECALCSTLTCHVFPDGKSTTIGVSPRPGSHVTRAVLETYRCAIPADLHYLSSTKSAGLASMHAIIGIALSSFHTTPLNLVYRDTDPNRQMPLSLTANLVLPASFSATANEGFS